MTAPLHVPPAPSVLRLVQRVVLGRWRASGEDLYREVGQAVGASRGQEIIVSGCGDGLTSQWLAARTGASVTGVDADRDRVAMAEARARSSGLGLPLTYENGALDDLPHESAVFDGAVGEPALAAAADPARAVAELLRVTRPMGRVALLQLTWCAGLGATAREMLVERLGLRPRMLVEWKQMLRDAGAVDVAVQDWTSGGPGCAAAVTPECELTWQNKAQIVGRAWRRWGWREARDAVEREETLLRELSRERSIGFQLITGVKWPHRQPA